MKRINFTIVLSLMVMLANAQELTEGELSAIRAAFRDAKQQVEINSHAQEQNVPRNDMEVISHHVIPGGGPTEEVIHYYFTLDEDPETGTYVNRLYLITRSYNVAARKFYQEFLFEKQESTLLFFFHRNDAQDGTTDETRYYYGKNGVHKSVKGTAELDEVFAHRLADDLKTAFDHLMNKN